MTTIRKYSWWESPRSKRFFVIVEIWWKAVGEIAKVELLERGERDPVEVGAVELEKLIEKKELVEVLPEELPNPYK